jgi:hypothetical protein
MAHRADLPGRCGRTCDVDQPRRPLMNSMIRILSVLSLLGLWSGLDSKAMAEKLPQGVEQILERGKIAAIFNPQFVAADEAEITDEAWVLGVEIDGQARAYSLNLLNRHEVVNDKIGEKSFAAVW